MLTNIDQTRLIPLHERKKIIIQMSESLIEFIKTYPKSVATALVLTVIWVRRKRRTQNPFYDKRKLKSGLTKKQVLGTPFKPEEIGPEIWDVIVIGSGGSGLVSANILSRAGLKVLVLERHDRVGGCLHSFEAGGYEFDTGVHYVGQMSKTMDFLTDGKLKWEEMDTTYDIVKLQKDDKMESFSITKSKDNQSNQLKSMLLQKFPKEEKAISRFLNQIRKSKKASATLLLYKRLPNWILRVLIKLGLHRVLFDNDQLTVSTRRFLDSITTNEKLKCVLSYSFGACGTIPSESPIFMNMATFA